MTSGHSPLAAVNSALRASCDALPAARCAIHTGQVNPGQDARAWSG
ncbi:hypothetical protein ThrDRAFT_04346 [Frankia casuarinae]|nr:hypothetical protein CcI6DRAFT_01194 [Frankia sp. CcI6]EYT90028.1 hypothetical protein ThrDRAFT_04346 [Frankia casuarinae]KDA40962.1 hypothetical protein BMG523Draft_04206 [Frankia sp. BMG5.23]KEZ34518.1 hypothetical protein CEDDRAFT_04143 [Frankia sp. CeD]KFB03631.1 hypothetical protein ALLO2DRAFT_03673 [Frankia sp. Allo2]